MSTFRGRMREYCFISLDRFDAENLHSVVFFLSHVHRDHTQGLGEDRFYHKLKRNSAVKVYCSKLTRDLLLADSTYSRLREHMIGLDVYEPYSIQVPESKKIITVTLLQSGHCPGSVMFLIEGSEGTVLYTGDFRFEKDGIRFLPILNSANGPKPLKSLYIDTTFWIPEAYFIPTREDSCEALVTLAREWVTRSSRHFLVIKHKADLGYEYLLRHLSDELGMKIHVSQARYKTFEMIADMTDFVTTDPHETQLHACKWLMGGGVSSALPCSHEHSDAKNISVRTIVLSTMWFVRTVHRTDWVQRMNDSCYRLCYSFHSSYSEIRDIISYLRPQSVYPNVVPSYPRRMTLKEVQQQLDQHLNAYIAKAAGKLLTPKKLKTSASVPQLGRKRKVDPGSLDEFDFGDSVLDFLSPKAKILHTPVKRRPSSVSSSPEFKLLLGSPSGTVCKGDSSQDDDGNTCAAASDDLFNSQKSSLSARLAAADDFGDDDDDSQSWMTADDVALLANFRPLNNGKFSQHIAYVSSSDSETDSEGGICKQHSESVECISSDESVIVIDELCSGVVRKETLEHISVTSLDNRAVGNCAVNKCNELVGGDPQLSVLLDLL